MVYKAKSDKSKISQIIDIIGKNRYILLLVKTNKGSIFGAYTYFYDYDNYLHTTEKELGIVFNFIDVHFFAEVGFWVEFIGVADDFLFEALRAVVPFGDG